MNYNARFVAITRKHISDGFGKSLSQSNVCGVRSGVSRFGNEGRRHHYVDHDKRSEQDTVVNVTGVI